MDEILYIYVYRHPWEHIVNLFTHGFSVLQQVFQFFVWVRLNDICLNRWPHIQYCIFLREWSFYVWRGGGWQKKITHNVNFYFFIFFLQACTKQTSFFFKSKHMYRYIQPNFVLQNFKANRAETFFHQFFCLPPINIKWSLP